MFLPEFQKSGSKNRTPIFSRLYILSTGTKPSNQISFKQRRIYSINELISQKRLCAAIEKAVKTLNSELRRNYSTLIELIELNNSELWLCADHEKSPN